jgi:hypothetical protein
LRLLPKRSRSCKCRDKERDKEKEYSHRRSPETTKISASVTASAPIATGATVGACRSVTSKPSRSLAFARAPFACASFTRR